MVEKIDWNIVYKILQAIVNDNFDEYLSRLDANVEQDTLALIEILIDENLIKGVEIVTSSTGFLYKSNIPRLTKEGLELFNALKNLNLWSKIKTTAKKAGVSLSFEFVKATIPLVLKDLVKQFF